MLIGMWKLRPVISREAEILGGFLCRCLGTLTETLLILYYVVKCLMMHVSNRLRFLLLNESTPFPICSGNFTWQCTADFINQHTTTFSMTV